MELNGNKCVMVIDEVLPFGVIAVDFSDVAQSAMCMTIISGKQRP